MTSWTRRMARGVAVAGMAAALLAAPGAAFADTVQGKGLVVAKDLAQQTLTLNGERVLHVTPSTVFADATGSRTSLAALPVASQDAPGMYRVSAEATVQFEGTTEGERIVAHRVQIADEALE